MRTKGSVVGDMYINMHACDHSHLKLYDNLSSFTLGIAIIVTSWSEFGFHTKKEANRLCLNPPT